MSRDTIKPLSKSEKTRLRACNSIERRPQARQDDIAYGRELLLDVVRVIDLRCGSPLDRLRSSGRYDVLDLGRKALALAEHARSSNVRRG